MPKTNLNFATQNAWEGEMLMLWADSQTLRGDDDNNQDNHPVLKIDYASIESKHCQCYSDIVSCY